MKEMQYLRPAIGVCIGWLLNSVNSFLSGYREDRKVLKAALYHLLTACHLVDKLRQEKFELGLRKMIEQVPEISDPAQREEFFSFARPYFAKIQVESVLHGDSLPKLRMEYSEVLKELARIKPLTAYLIADSANVDEVFAFLEKMIDAAETTLSITATVEERGQFDQWMKPKLVEAAFVNLKTDIKKIAWQIGFFTYLNSQKLIRRLDLPMPDEAIKNGAETMSGLIQQAAI